MTNSVRFLLLAGSGRTIRACPAAIVLALATLLSSPPMALGQADEDPAALLEDFVHYSRIAKVELAVAYGEKLLASGATDAELAQIVEESEIGLKRFDAALDRALRVPELETIAGEVGRRVERGRLDLARESKRIDEAIAMLTGSQRQRMLAAGRLKAAGEYAVPALLQEITEGRDEKLKLACQDMLRTIGLPACSPLCAALEELDPRSQRIACDVLGDIGYGHAAPYLLELTMDESADGPVREAADRALRKIQVAVNDPSTAYSDLARQYYDRLGSLIAYPYEDTNNIWSYDAFVGLIGTPVPTDIYTEIMAMQLAARALGLDPNNQDAIALYVAANLKRENDLPAGASDPIYGEQKYSPEFFATVFGTEVCLDVLDLALGSSDTVLVRDAIAALAQTTGGANLFTTARADGSQPLIAALGYPDRRVQYEAALTLARALPDTGFEGDFRVVPLLASAVRMGDQAFAIVVADDDEDRRQAVADLERVDFTVAGAESSVPALTVAIAEAAGVDLVVVRMTSADAARQAIADLRGVAKTVAAPILVLAPGVDLPALRLEFGSDSQLKLSKPGVGEVAYAAALDELLQRAAGGRLTEAEAEAYAFDALGALEDVAISCTPAYEIADAETALLDALDTRTGRARLLVAGILARIDSDVAQRRLFDAALSASGGERIDLLDRVAESVKRFGDRAEKRHVAALLDLVINSGGSTAEAAARVHGAMNIRDSEASKLIEG